MSGAEMTFDELSSRDGKRSFAELATAFLTPQRIRSAAILLVLVVFMVIGSFLSPHFLTASNLLNVARQMSIVGIVGMGMTFVILTAGIDLSVGSTLGLSAVTAAWLLSSGVLWPVAMLLAVFVGAAVGAVNGLGITRGGIQPFIMTLAMLVIVRGFTMTVSSGQPIPLGDTSSSIAWVGSGNFLGLPVPVWILGVVFAYSSFVLRNTRFGWHVYAVGGNLEGARRSGLNTKRTLSWVYVIAGAYAGLASLIIVSRITVGAPLQGAGLELDAIAVVVIGGTSLFGGVGAVGTTLIGAAILSVMDNLLNLLGVSPFSQQIVKGLIILGAVLLERRVPVLTVAGRGGGGPPPIKRIRPEACEKEDEMKGKNGGWIGLIAILALVVAACGTGGSDTTTTAGDAGENTTTTAGAPDEPVVIGFSQANNGDVWRINQTNNVVEACESLIPGAQVVVTDGQGEGSKQSADVDDLITQGIDVLLLTPLTADELTPAAQRALDAGIPVITLDRAVNIDVTQHIGADNKLIGRAAAEFVSQTLLGGEGGKVIEIQGVLGASATTDRHDDFVAWLEENDPSVEIIESQTGEYRREPAFEFMNDMLQRYAPGEFDVVYTHNDEMALGAVQSMKEAGRLGEAAIVGVDGQNEAIQAIADGEIAATFTYDNAGKEACESAAKLIAGESIDPEWILDTNQIDETNAEEWIGAGF